jgi:hypothetical protein
MKTFVLILTLLFLAAGCTDLIAKGPTAKAINADVDLARAAVPLAGEPATLALERQAGRFAYYHETATVNFFAYLFGRPTIYCTPKLYTNLMMMEVQAEQTAADARAGEFSSTDTAFWTGIELRWFEQIKRERDGK